MKTSQFRVWLQNIWMANADERREFGFGPISQEEYFKRYKYWLRREYKFQRSQDN